jgi:hypothetical protein
MTTCPDLVPSNARATLAPRVLAMVKTTANEVTVTQSQHFFLASRHDVSSIPTTGASGIASAGSATGAARSAAHCRSSFAIMPVEIDSPRRSAARSRIGLLPRR